MGKVVNVGGRLCYLHHIDVDKERALRERLEYAIEQPLVYYWTMQGI